MGVTNCTLGGSKGYLRACVRVRGLDGEKDRWSKGGAGPLPLGCPRWCAAAAAPGWDVDRQLEHAALVHSALGALHRQAAQGCSCRTPRLAARGRQRQLAQRAAGGQARTPSSRLPNTTAALSRLSGSKARPPWPGSALTCRLASSSIKRSPLGAAHTPGGGSVCSIRTSFCIRLRAADMVAHKPGALSAAGC